MAVKRKTFENLATKFLKDTFADFKKVDVQINELVTIADAQGGRSKSYQAFGDPIEAFIFPLSGDEEVDAGRYFTDQDFRFMFKPVSGINNKMQFVSGGDTYGIVSIKDIAKADVWMTVIAEINPAS